MSTANSYAALIIDNNLTSSKTFSSMLKRNFNMNALYASSTGQEAILAAKNAKKMDWVFCDSNLPDRDCFQLLDDLKEIDSTRQAKIILISSSSNRDLLIQATNSGVREFILKPFTQKTILAKLTKLTNGKSLRKNKRITLLKAYEAEINFSGVQYKSSLIDISFGGCMVSSEVFNNGGGLIYDTASINIQLNDENLDFTGQLIRIERDTSSNAQMINSAFLFHGLSNKTVLALNKFLEKIKH